MTVGSRHSRFRAARNADHAPNAAPLRSAGSPVISIGADIL
jgi:hypothetical protein